MFPLCAINRLHRGSVSDDRTRSELTWFVSDDRTRSDFTWFVSDDRTRSEFTWFVAWSYHVAETVELFGGWRNAPGPRKTLSGGGLGPPGQSMIHRTAASWYYWACWRHRLVAKPNSQCSGPAVLSFRVKVPDFGAGRWYGSWIFGKCRACTFDLVHQWPRRTLGKAPACCSGDLSLCLEILSVTLAASDYLVIVHLRWHLSHSSINKHDMSFSSYWSRDIAIHIDMDCDGWLTRNLALDSRSALLTDLIL